MNRRGFAPIIIIFIIAAAVLVGGGGYYAWKSSLRTLDDFDDTPLKSRVVETSWKTYRDENNGFEISYPSAWFIQFEEPTVVLASVPKEKNPHGIGIPGGAWAEIMKLKAPCNYETKDFTSPPLPPEPRTWDKIVCRGNFTIHLGFWDNDPQKDVQKNNLQIIADSFKFISQEGASVDDCQKLVNQAEQYFGSGATYPRDLLLAECKKYLGKSCITNQECGSFPCVNNVCLIKPCNSDNQCPSLCGLHATPTPRFCTTLDVQ